MQGSHNKYSYANSDFYFIVVASWCLITLQTTVQAMIVWLTETHNTNGCNNT